MSVEIPLVQEIAKRQVLYNSNLPEYNRKDTLDSAWAEVADALNLTVTECKDKWKNIRSSYVRSLRTVGGKQKKPYYLSKYLKFVTPYLKPAVSDDSLPLANFAGVQDDDYDSSSMPLIIKIEQDVESDCEQTLVEQLDTAEKETEVQEDIHNGRVRKRKRQLLGKTSTTFRNKTRRTQPYLPPRIENNASKYFLLSLLPELDTLDDDQLRLFKIKVMLLIDEIKTDGSKARESFPSNKENARLQKRLINLLLKNLEKSTNST